MKRIAAIDEKKTAENSSSWRLHRDEIEVLHYGWRPRPKKTIKAVNNGSFIMLATTSRLKKSINICPDIAITDGKLLQLAFLPQILDRQRPLWQQETMIINADHPAGRLALSLLLKKTGKISLSGKAAAAVSAALFAKYGIITEQPSNGFRLSSLTMPESVSTVQGIIDINLAEALLAADSGYYPAVHPQYLQRLAVSAAAHGFYPLL